MNKLKESDLTGWRWVLPVALLIFCIFIGISAAFVYAFGQMDDRKLQNGSFEEEQEWTDAFYKQPDQSKVPHWNTTAFQGKIELFRENTGTYIKNVTLTPTNGTYAAELNADEESTLYQNVKTTPSSVYEWGLDHGGRNGTDTMALVIGPKQDIAPSKPNKEGRDQLMQMIDWLIQRKKTSVKTSAGLGEKLTVYSKKFAEKGTFCDNAEDDAFSLIPSTIYTEEWHIWIMASSCSTEGNNVWNSYGFNAEGSAGMNTGETELDFNKYYLYTVPSGQTETLFGFVSVGYVDSAASADKAKTYGNFLDNVNFHLYHPLSGSSTNHGSAVIGGSDGVTEGTGSESGHTVTVNDKLATYVTDGDSLKIQAIVKKKDAENGCEFIGVYCTRQNTDGIPETIFLQKAGNEIEDEEKLPDDEKKDVWIRSINDEGDIVYTYYMDEITAATSLHFVFIKNPTITYDANGGKQYSVNSAYHPDEDSNVYSFKPLRDDTVTFIPPYVSHAAEGQNDGWKFMGWLLTGDAAKQTGNHNYVNTVQLGKMILPAVHTVGCDYSVLDATHKISAQYFHIYDGNVAMTEEIQQSDLGEICGCEWNPDKDPVLYANDHMGLTMVAQWRWRQAFIPQTGNGETYVDSVSGGTVEIISVSDKTDENYNASYTENGGKSYYAKTSESVAVKAIENPGYTFEGWYDADGNLVSRNSIYRYVETKESVKTFYARFSGSVTQTFKRQVKGCGGWNEITDDTIGTLGRYTYTDAPGMPIRSTATAGEGYLFIGWYDKDGKPVPDNMIQNERTISYTTEIDATYYARFERAYTIFFEAQTKQADGSFLTDTIGGTVSVSAAKDINGAKICSEALENEGYQFIGWYEKDGKLISLDHSYIARTTPVRDGMTYYARFEPTE